MAQLAAWWYPQSFSKEQCFRLIELQQQYQAAGDHESMALVAHYAAGGVDLSVFVEAQHGTGLLGR